jgi:ABC-type transport system substrate-binding protein
VSEDGLTYTFEPRPGVKWHDGAPFAVADVASVLLMLKEVHPRGRSTFGNLVEVRTPDDLTAALVLCARNPHAAFDERAGNGVMPNGRSHSARPRPDVLAEGAH